jgi:hypothetical protein
MGNTTIDEIECSSTNRTARTIIIGQQDGSTTPPASGRQQPALLRLATAVHQQPDDNDNDDSCSEINDDDDDVASGSGKSSVAVVKLTWEETKWVLRSRLSFVLFLAAVGVALGIATHRISNDVEEDDFAARASEEQTVLSAWVSDVVTTKLVKLCNRSTANRVINPGDSTRLLVVKALLVITICF